VPVDLRGPFLHALNFCMLLPGPKPMQLATYIGWRFNGTLGTLAAGLLFALPRALVVVALSITYALYGHVPPVEAAVRRHQGGRARHCHRAWHPLAISTSAAIAWFMLSGAA
jgi:hypothetical protein